MKYLPSRLSLLPSFCALSLSLLLSACATPGSRVTGEVTPAPVRTASAATPAPRFANTKPRAIKVVSPAPLPTPKPEVDLSEETLSPEYVPPPKEPSAQALQAQDLWERIRLGFKMPDLESELATDQTQWYASKPEYFARITERSKLYLYSIVEEIEGRNMPTELALLPFIESAFNPQANSSAKAAGMWQFIPSTGKDYALTQNVFRDERRDVLQSTRAALDYLQRLYDMFGDWHLALAAYNWGEGNVKKAIARNQKAELPSDYVNLKMPKETQYYVPKFQAIKNLVAHPEQFNLKLPEIDNHPYFRTTNINRDMDVHLAAKLAEIPLSEFQALNPSSKKPVLLAAGTQQVLLPWGNAEKFERNLSAYRGQLASWTAWTAPATMKTAEAAKRVGMTEMKLREVNNIPPKMLVKGGSTLLVPRSANKVADVPEQVADHAQMSLAPEPPTLRAVKIRAGKKDTWASVAKRFRTKPEQVAQWNKASVQVALIPGQNLVVYVPVKAKKAAPRKHAAAQTAKK